MQVRSSTWWAWSKVKRIFHVTSRRRLQTTRPVWSSSTKTTPALPSTRNYDSMNVSLVCPLPSPVNCFAIVGDAGWWRPQSAPVCPGPTAVGPLVLLGRRRIILGSWEEFLLPGDAIKLMTYKLRRCRRHRRDGEPIRWNPPRRNFKK